MEKWVKWSKGQRALTTDGRHLIQGEGEKVVPMMGDLVLALDDGMQQLKMILPDQIQSVLESVVDLQKDMDGYGLLLNQVIGSVGKQGRVFRDSADPTVWRILDSNTDRIKKLQV